MSIAGALWITRRSDKNMRTSIFVLTFLMIGTVVYSNLGHTKEASDLKSYKNWFYSKSYDKFDDSPIYASLIQNAKEQTLIVKCYSKGTVVVISPGPFTFIPHKKIKVVYRLDKETPVNHDWHVSRSTQIFVHGDFAIKLALEMAKRKSLVVKVKGDVIEFDLEGSTKIIADMNKNCGWGEAG